MPKYDFVNTSKGTINRLVPLGVPSFIVHYEWLWQKGTTVFVCLESLVICTNGAARNNVKLSIFLWSLSLIFNRCHGYLLNFWSQFSQKWVPTGSFPLSQPHPVTAEQSWLVLDCVCYCRQTINDVEADKIAFDVYKEISKAERSKHKLLHAKLSKTRTAVGKKEAQSS